VDPELPQGIPEDESAGQREEGAGHPEKGKKDVIGHLDVKEKGKAGYDQGSDDGGLENVKDLCPKGGQATGIVETERGENDVPEKEDSAEEREIPYFDPHRNEFAEVDVGFGVRDGCRGGEKGADHDQQVEERVDLDENLPVPLDHIYNLL
jgi:hypothetical protein